MKQPSRISIRRFLAPVLLAPLVAACAPAVATQAQRLSYLDSMVKENLHKSMNCDSVNLDFQKSEQAGVEWYDIYKVDGCGQQSDYVTKVSQQSYGPNIVTSWGFGLAASEADFQAAAESQLRKTASFELGCKELEFTTLQAIMARMRNAYESSIGAGGCGKKATYKTSCAIQGFTAGKHEITCSSIANHQ